LKANFTDKLASRLALARSIYRPDFKQLQENIGLEQKINSTSGEVTYQGGNSGNAKLRPLKADAIDLSLEWNPKSGQALTAVLFAKDVKDIIGDATYTRTYNSAAGTPQTFLITGPANVAKARMHGIELSADSYLDHFDFLKDKLPTWSKGLGVSANYSYIASEQTYYRDGGFKFCPGSELKNSANQIYGCDTNGLPYKDKLPMQGVAKNVANFALRYDTGGFSGRLAYNWNSRSLQGMDKGGAGCWDDGCHGGTSADPAQAGKTDTWYGVPVYEEAYGQWDASAGYTFNKKFSMSLSVSNLNNVVVRRTHEQAPGVMGVEWKFPGQSYYLSGRYEF
jgi:TonB-dependent receptor